MLGMIIVIGGATLIALFPADTGTDDSEKKATTGEVLTLFMFSLIITVSLSCEMMASKMLAARNVDPRYIGFNFLLTCGAIGTVCLIVVTAMGKGV